MDADELLYGRGLVGTFRPSVSGVLAQRFKVPPFSVLNAREGSWQDRKRAWLSLGIEGEVPGGVAGRADDLTWNIKSDGYDGPGRSVNPGGSPMPAAQTANGKTVRGDGRGRPPAVPSDPAGRAGGLTRTGQAAAIGGYRVKEGKKEESAVASTSIFDPVLCELIYTWFAPPGGIVVDPFAGGAVRGIVAAALGLKYWGAELRPEQIAANQAQKAAILPAGKIKWVQGDAAVTVPTAPFADLIFGCPPYGDLEVYSNLPEDLSAMPEPEFRAAYAKIVAAACERLNNNRFAVFVTGDYRDKKTGNYRNFSGYTIRCFKQSGLELYNEAILVTAVASLSMRAGKQFEVSRKLGRGHQTVHVFIKGDARIATEAINAGNAL